MISLFSQGLRRWSDLSLLMRVTAVVGTALAVMGAMVWLATQRGPRATGEPVTAATRVPLDAGQMQLSDQVGELERSAQRILGAEGKREDAIGLLDHAIAAERDLLRRNAQAGLEQTVRLDRLVTLRDNERAKLATARIDTLEQTAEDAARAGRPEATIAPLREAWQAQRAVNNSEADAHHKDFVREMSLALAIDQAEAEPLHREVEAAVAAAQAAVADRRWADALAADQRAQAAQQTLNRKYPRTPFADIAGLDRIEAEIASLNAAGEAAEIDAREREADAVAERGRAMEAAGLYRAAVKRQHRLNVDFAKSRFVSTARIEALEVKRQTVLAAEILTAVAELDRAGTEALRKRQVLRATGKLADAASLLDLVATTYPKTRGFDGALKIKLAYLGRRRDQLRSLQDEVYARLAPVPDQANRLLLKTEVPQSLYATIVSTNPSRQVGAELPVDSVNWHDAQEFCRRLGWVLGTTVRLPTLAEFQAAGGDGDGARWSAENAGGHSHPTGAAAPNAAGFGDLAGNLAEWLAAGEGATAPVAGGSYLDGAKELRVIPVRALAKDERARHVGFRVVVELVFD